MLIYQIPGAYVPLTKEGSIIVDGVLASCYPSVNHDLSNFGMTPMKWFPEVVEWIFGEDNGLQSFAIIAENIGNIIDIDYQNYQSVL